MHKALMGVILAATAMTPVAAQAQQSNDRSEHYERLERRNQQRHEQRQQRREAREQRQEARQQSQQEQAAPVVRPQRVERDADGGERTVRRGGDFRRDRRDDGVQVDRRVVQTQQDRVLRRQRFENQTTGSASQAWQGDPDDPRRQHYERLERRNQWRYGTSEQRDAIRDQWRDRDGDRNWRRGDRDWRRGDRDWRRNWDRDWRRDRRYDWSSWRGRHRNLFRLSPYYSPYRNWGYNRFSIGLFMPSLFYGQRYWLSDPGYYRLPPAPPGTQWIRYYNDVLLVDTWSGEVVDVIYNFFW